MVIVVMGVSGSGKTTVGRALAERLGVDYAEADEFHPPENIAKMSAGHPLNDEDRWPWLRAIADWIREHSSFGGVVTCSALKRAYRDVLRQGGPVFFVHLDGTREKIAERLGARKGHFMPPALLDSQIADLEPLGPDEPGVVLDVSANPEELTEAAYRAVREAEALERFGLGRVARLATVSAEGRPHIVPVTFAVTGRVVVMAVDHKPKSTRNLKRLRNIAANPAVSLLVDEYAEDWTQLWWVRVDGTAEISDQPAPELVEKYPQYQQNPPEGPFIRVHISTVASWSAS